MAVEFQAGEVLSAKELYTRLGISKSSWDNRRPIFLENLQKFYEVEVIGNGRSRQYRIGNKIADYEPPMTARDRKKMQLTYNEAITEQIRKPHGDIQTYRSLTTSVRRDAKQKIEQFDHKERTSYQYICIGTKELFGARKGEQGTCGKCLGNVWVERLDENAPYPYRELSELECNDWIHCIKTTRITDREWAEFLVTIELNEEDDVEQLFREKINLSYQSAKLMFSEKWHFVPTLARKYEINRV